MDKSPLGWLRLEPLLRRKSQGLAYFQKLASKRLMISALRLLACATLSPIAGRSLPYPR
jgi:hypothetical protein